MSDKKYIIALGFFDGVHVGHRRVILKAKETAENFKFKSAAITFKGNLRGFFKKGEKRIFNDEEETFALKSFGLDKIIYQKVNKKTLSKSGKEFLDYLVKKYNAKGFVCGKDFRFGVNASFSVSDLALYCDANNLYLEVVEDVNFFDSKNENKVSSSLIKSYLSKGMVERANKILTFDYFCIGRVKGGRHVGRKLGYPTINVNIEKDKVKLKTGVYFGTVTVDKKEYKSIINYGNVPTFNVDNQLIEAHLLNFNKNIYGKKVLIKFNKYVRDIVRFNSVDLLIKQLEKDKRDREND